MKNLLIKLALAILTRYAQQLLAQSLDNSASEVIRARELIEQFESGATSGEYKRHQVFARLIKEFPHIRKSKLGLLIEQIVNERP